MLEEAVECGGLNVEKAEFARERYDAIHNEIQRSMEAIQKLVLEEKRLGRHIEVKNPSPQECRLHRKGRFLVS